MPTLLRFLCAVALALATFGVSQPALAQNILASNPESVARAIRDKGLEANLTTDNEGDPMVEVTAEGQHFVVFFYDCVNNRNCKTLCFFAFWQNTNADRDLINAWNRDKRHSRAYIDKDNDAVLEMDVNLNAGGISPGLFADDIDRWMVGLIDYARYIGAPDA